jgi:hypothetical protein
MTEEQRREAARGVHDALNGYLDEGEIVLSWVLVMDVAGGEHQRYLSHRSGGGHDGTDQPMPSACQTKLAEMQLRHMTCELDDDDEDEDDE